MFYTKQPYTCDQLIELLKNRGLLIEDEVRAKKYLQNVGYFRLTGYMYHLQTSDGLHLFRQGTTFNDIILHYQFDKKLRILFLEYLERIEIALRARLTDRFSIPYGFYWYTNRSLYEDIEVCSSINSEILQHYSTPQERFLKAFKNKYSSESLPPSNMALEILTLGKLSRLYQGLSNKTEKMQIADDFGLPSSWITLFDSFFLVHIPNQCKKCMCASF